MTHQTLDFMQTEIRAVKSANPNIPVTTNMMGTYQGLNYWEMAPSLDVISWDSYPEWHSPDALGAAIYTAFHHDLNRSFKKQPFLLMECTPSQVNWKPVNKLKRPGMHRLSALQTVAHGGDGVMYFQFRKSRRSAEKFHGAVVDHCGHEHTHVFQDVAEVGAMLRRMDPVVGSGTPSKAAILYDWENCWMLNDAQAFHQKEKKYQETIVRHYRNFWEAGINVDILNSAQELDSYRLVIVPMLYSVSAKTKERLARFVRNGGTLVATYHLGQVNEHDLCYLGGFPCEELKEVFGLWAEETDALYDGEQALVQSGGKTYPGVELCEIVHPTTARVLATYASEFYSGSPAVLQNQYGKGNAYYLAFRDTGEYQKDFYSALISSLQLKTSVPGPIPEGVSAHTRETDRAQFLFIENYNAHTASLRIGAGYPDLLTGKTTEEEQKLAPFDGRVFVQYQ